MSDDKQQILKNIAQLFESQRFAVLSTQKMIRLWCGTQRRLFVKCH